MSNRQFKRAQAKEMYKKAVKGIPKRQRVPFSKVYKTLLAKEARESISEDDSKKAAELGEEADLLADLVLTDHEAEKKDDVTDTTTVEQDLIL